MVAAALAVLVAVGVLLAAGVDQRSALLGGGGLLVIGLAAFGLLRAAGLLTTTGRP